MDQTLLKASAHRLEKLLTKYASLDSEAKLFLESISEYLTDAQSGKIITPKGWGEVPGTYYFNEGSLRKYNDLEAAYADFKIEITGGESPALKMFLSSGSGE